MGRLKKEDRALLQAKKGKKKKEKKRKEKKKERIEPNHTNAEVTDLEQKVVWTWMDLEGKTAGHMMKWIRQSMID
jgi:hypothetical protein